MTLEWWATGRHEFDIFVSLHVHDEVAAGNQDFARKRLALNEPLPILESTAATNVLAKAILDASVMPRKASNDAADVAVSVVRGMDYLLTCTCTHITNARILRRLQRDCLSSGFRCPVTCTPLELMGERS